MTIDATALEKFARNYARILSTGRSLNETDTRNMVVNPLLTTLGWEFIPDEIECEYPLQIGSKTTHVDYCLKLDGNPVALVEAKALSVTLTDQVLDQATSYARVAQLRWGIVTNGRDLALLDADAKVSQSRERIVFVLPLGQLDAHRQYLEALSPDGMRRGALTEIAEEIAGRKDIVKEYERLAPAARAEIIRSLSTLPQVSDSASLLVDELMAKIKGIVEGSAKAIDTVDFAPATSAPATGVAFNRIPRAELTGRDNALVIVCPANPDGLAFVEKNQAWAQVFLKERPEYCALYITKPHQAVRILAPIRRIVPVMDWTRERGLDPAKTFRRGIKPHKFALEFSQAAVELADPISLQQGEPHVQGPRYTTLGRLKTARSIGDLWNDP